MPWSADTYVGVVCDDVRLCRVFIDVCILKGPSLDFAPDAAARASIIDECVFPSFPIHVVDFCHPVEVKSVNLSSHSFSFFFGTALRIDKQAGIFTFKHIENIAKIQR